jgi:phosphate-selective porin OprO and OprP
MNIRKKKLTLLATSFLCVLAPAPIAAAQTIQDLKEQIALLSKKVDELEKKEMAAAKVTPNLKVAWKGAPEFSSLDNKFKMKIRGRLYFDYGSVTAKDGFGVKIPASKIDGTEVRTARLGVEGVLYGHVKYKFESDFAGNDVNVKDAYIQYHFQPVSVKVGQFKHMNSLEEQTSSRYTTFMERASFTDTFKLARRVGIAAGQSGKNWTINFGYFFEGIGSTNASGNDKNLFAARATFSPKIDDNTKIHLGASLFRRNENGNVFNLGYSQRPHSHQAGKFVKSQKFDVRNEIFFGAELAGVRGPFSLQGEWSWVRNKLDPSELLTAKNPKYNGGYVSLGYFVTGESRSYNASKGSFGRTKVLHPVDEGGMGAWQIAARFDTIDLVHGAFGEKQNTYLFGINWHLNNYARIMANYSHSTVKDNNGIAKNKIDAFGSRFQVDW